MESGLCPDCKRPVEQLSEHNYFFKMGQYQNQLLDHIKQHPSFIRPESRRNEVLGFLQTQKLGDLSISRPKSRLSWGIELPFDHRLRDLCLVRCAGELHVRPGVPSTRETGRQSLLACHRASRRQRHLDDPCRVLVHDADGVEPPVTGDHLRPWLVDRGWRKDVEEPRQCRRSEQDGRAIRRGCVSVFLTARSAVWTGWGFFPVGHGHPCQQRSGQWPRQSFESYIDPHRTDAGRAGTGSREKLE